MPITNFPDGISSFGVPQYGMGGFIPAGGTVYWVAPGLAGSSDGNNGLTPDQALKTLSKAHSLMTANQNDVAIIVGNSSASSTTSVRETETLVWSKNLCHIIGTAYNRVSHRVSLRAVTNDFTPLMSITADGCVFANFHLVQGYGTSEAQVCLAVTGQRNAFYNLHIAGMAHASAAGHTGGRNLTFGGSQGNGEHYFQDCAIGLDTTGRGVENMGVEFLTGVKVARVEFQNCKFLMNATAATPAHVLITANSVDRYILFKGCQFMNSGTFTGGSTINDNFKTVDPISAVMLLQNCVSTGADDWEDGDSGDVYVEDVYAAAKTGIMVTTSVS